MSAFATRHENTVAALKLAGIVLLVSLMWEFHIGITCEHLYSLSQLFGIGESWNLVALRIFISVHLAVGALLIMVKNFHAVIERQLKAYFATFRILLIGLVVMLFGWDLWVQVMKWVAYSESVLSVSGFDNERRYWLAVFRCLYGGIVLCVWLIALIARGRGFRNCLMKLIGKKSGHPLGDPVKHPKSLSATGGQGTGPDSMKDGQGVADCASFQAMDKPVVGASKHWSPASRLTPE